MNVECSKAQCRYCGEVAGFADEGQHITMFECQRCGRNNEARHRPDPDPLPTAVNDKRVAVILSMLDSFGNAALSMPLRYDLPLLLHVHQSAQDTVNYLFGYHGRKTIMIGRKKNSAAVAPKGRAAVL